ncbi:unnamed protein product, partial [Urochloa humidicola]
HFYQVLYNHREFLDQLVFSVLRIKGRVICAQSRGACDFAAPKQDNQLTICAVEWVDYK